MYKKLFVLASFVLMLGSVSSAADIQWTAGGRNKLWSTGANWDLGRAPTLDDEVRIDVPAAAAPNGPVIQDGIAAQAKGIFTEAAGEPTLTMTGGSLVVADWIWWGDGPGSFAIWTMSGGTVDVANEFELGWGGGAGTLIMSGGTVNAGEAVIPTDTGAFGHLYLNGGTYNVTKPGGFKVNANGLIDITAGTLVLEGDETARINDLAAAGQITALGGKGVLDVDYNVRNAGKTTVTGAPAPPEPVRPSDAGLVAYYAMENDVNDSSGNGLHGTIIGDPEFVEGVSGMALSFDGAGDIVDCGNDPSLAITGAVTMTAWINVGALGLDHKVGGNQDGANGGYKMTVFNNDKVEFEIRTATNSAVLNRSVAGGTVLEAGVWYHVAGVYSLQDGHIRTYVNGALDRELATTAELGASPGNLFIGCEPFNTGSYNFNGVMDELRLYNVALTPGEIMYLAGHRATPVDPGADGLVARYEFENDVDDSSGNGLHGTIVGDPTFVEGPPGLGMALDFDGDGDYVDCGNPPEFTIRDQITFAYWIKVRAFDAGWNTVIAKGDDSWRSSRAGTNNFMEAAVSGTSGNYLYGSTPVDDEQWHHVAAVYDGATFKLYVDGGLDGLEESTGQIAVSNYNVYIGENSQATGRHWNGLIDNVVIYSRALSTGEVLYLAGYRPGDPSQVIYYSFDDVGGTVADQSGKGHDGAVVGDVTAEAAGKYNGAAKLANTGYLDLDGANFPAEDIPTSGLTLAAWTNIDGTSNQNAIFNARASDATWLIHPEIRPGNGDYRFTVRKYGGVTIGNINGGTPGYKQPEGTPVPNEWVHVAMTFSRADARVILYVNGEVVAEAATSEDADMAGDWGLGARVGYNIDDARHYTGLMDEFRMFTRALSQDEIKTIMQGP